MPLVGGKIIDENLQAKQQSNGGGGETAEVKGKEGSEKNETTEEKTAYLRDLRRSHSILKRFRNAIFTPGVLY